MARFIKGDVVVVPFPFSEKTGSKPRPALVLASLAYGNRLDYLLCIISSQPAPDPSLLEIEMADITRGSLNRKSFLRPSYLYTAGEKRIARKIGTLSFAKLALAVQSIIQTLTR